MTDTAKPAPVRDPSIPLCPPDLERLQHARAAAQAWLDACEVDTVKAKKRLDDVLAERQSAQAALELATENCEREMKLAQHPVALRRVG